MNALVLAILFSFLPQESELDRLKKEVDRLKAENASLAAKLKFQDLAELEKKHVEMARDKAVLQAKMAEAARQNLIFGSSYTVMSGKVTAISAEIGLVVIGIGSVLGIGEGDEFTITRKGEFVARVKVDRVDAQWCAGKIVQKTSDPVVGDDATRKDPRNAAVTPALKRATADEVQSLRKELDEVRNQVRQLSDRLLPPWHDHGVSMEGLSEVLLHHLNIRQGVLIREVREGSQSALLGLKPLDIVPDLGEADVLKILKGGGTLTVYRKGTFVTVSVDRKR